jgi:arylsulfatase
MPKVYKGAEQYPLNGVSMRYTFDNAEAPTIKKRQYYSMLGTRGLWQGGWKAVALHAPLSGTSNFDKDEWQLYHVDQDYSESKDLSKENPEKLKELIDAWFDEADKNFVLPLDDRTAVEILGIDRPKSEPSRERYVYYPHTGAVPEGVAVNIRGRSYKIIADVDITDKASGVMFAHGSRFGGHALFIKEKKLYYTYNFLGITEQKFISGDELIPGKHTLGMEFTWEKAGKHGESLGTTKLYINGKEVAQGPMKAQVGKFTLAGDGLCIGYDSADNVSSEYKSPGTFTGGTILGVGIDVSKEVYMDMEKEAAGALSRD